METIYYCSGWCTQCDISETHLTSLVLHNFDVPACVRTHTELLDDWCVKSHTSNLYLSKYNICRPLSVRLLSQNYLPQCQCETALTQVCRKLSLIADESFSCVNFHTCVHPYLNVPKEGA